MFDLLSPVHLVIMLVVALLIFGPRRLPEIGSSLGKGIREFRQSMNHITKELEAPTSTESPEEKKT